MVAVTVNTLPLVQAPDVGVTPKVAVTGAAVVLVSVLVIVDAPVPDAPPVRPVPLAGTAHAYVVPPGMVPVGVYENAIPVQEKVLCEAMFAIGLIVVVTVKVLPVQRPEVAVTP
jgi:hypothetical protein